MRPNQLVGVAGTNGSGKDTIMRFLSERYEYLFLAATDMLANELNRQGKDLTRENKAALSAQWRREQGMGVIVQRAYEEFMQQATTYQGLTVGSLRHPGEADAIHELGGLMIWVDADPRVRYDRLQANDRGRAAEDRITFEQFIAEEEREMHHTGDAATISSADVKTRCDIFISNDKDSIEAFEKHVCEALGLE